MYVLQIMETQYNASKFTCKNPKPIVKLNEITLLIKITNKERKPKKRKQYPRK